MGLNQLTGIDCLAGLTERSYRKTGAPEIPAIPGGNRYWAISKW